MLLSHDMFMFMHHPWLHVCTIQYMFTQFFVYTRCILYCKRTHLMYKCNMYTWSRSGGSRGGGGRIGRGPPFFRTILIFSGFFFFFFFFACHPGGRSGRRTVPLPNNVNVGPKNSGGKMCRSPPPHWATFSGLAGFFIFPAPPFHKSWIRHWAVYTQHSVYHLHIKIVDANTCTINYL